MSKINYDLLFDLAKRQNIPIRKAKPGENPGIYISDGNGGKRAFTVNDLIQDVAYDNSKRYIFNITTQPLKTLTQKKKLKKIFNINLTDIINLQPIFLDKLIKNCNDDIFDNLDALKNIEETNIEVMQKVIDNFQKISKGINEDKNTNVFNSPSIDKTEDIKFKVDTDKTNQSNQYIVNQPNEYTENLMYS